MDYHNGPTDAPAADPPPKKEYKLPIEELDTEFKRKFPPDPLGKEMEDGARVWKVYRDEATAHDTTMLDGWNKTLDILLIFAGLFSAVATAFVIESYQQLDTPSHDAYVATALYMLVAASNVSMGITLPPPPGLQAPAPELARWFNGLWFTSLLLSLSVALLSILVKQWIGEYTVRNNASAQSPRHWARRHQLFFGALNAWPVAELVSILPLLLHLSLFLFFAGVVAFLWTLDRAIGAWIVVLGLSLVVFYLACTLIPLWRPECPTSTPLVNQIRRGLVTCRAVVLHTALLILPSAEWLASVARRCLLRQRLHTTGSVTPETSIMKTTFALPLPETAFTLSAREHLRDILKRPIPARKSKRARLQDTLASLETQRTANDVIARHLQLHAEDLDTDVLQWLITSVSDSDAVAVGVQALGALHPESSLAHEVRSRTVLGNFDWRDSITRSTVGSNTVEAARVLRSLLCIRPNKAQTVFASEKYLYDPAIMSLKGVEYPDMALLYRWVDTYKGYHSFLPFFEFQGLPCPSPSLTSTSVLILSLPGMGINQILGLLLLCDFDRFGVADWDLVASLLRRHSNMCLSKAAARNLDTRLWLADWISGLLVSYREYDSFASAAVVLVTRILSRPDYSHIRRVSRLDSLKMRGRESLGDLPFLCDYLGSRRFREIRHDHDEMQSILSLLMGVDTRPKFMASEISTRRFVHIASNVLNASLICDSGPSLFTGEIVVFFRLMWLKDSSGIRDHPDASQLCVQYVSALLSGLLKPLHPSDTRPPIFEVIMRDGSSRFTCDERWRLIRDIAAGLAIMARQRIEEIGSLVESFFGLAHCSLLLKQWIALTEADAWEHHDDDERNVLFVQHCVEMQPSWWITGLRELMEDEHSDVVAVQEYAVWLNDEATRRGPCTVCPGVPLGWDTEFGDTEPLDSPCNSHHVA